ncbi:hypothetical protein M885DRAFT_587355 [Pelagophyceae sp. CCMP2097]|nr:hypothetical protein M885DRAFT_587355 [Pelagophyceae sp. CCMP2097]
MMLRRVVSSTLVVVRALSLGANRAVLQPRPARRSLGACRALALDAQLDALPSSRRDVGSAVARYAGAAVIRSNALSGEHSEIGALVEFADGSRGTIILERSALAIASVGDLNFDASVAGDAVVVLRNDTRLGASSSSVVGRALDSSLAPLDGPLESGGEAAVVFDDGLKQNEMQRIDAHLRTGFAGIDLVTPLGKGQSALFVGSAATLAARRLLALCAVDAQPAGVECIYAQLEAVPNTRPAARANVTTIVARAQPTPFASHVEAVWTASVALGLACDRRKDGAHVVVVLDSLDPIIQFWRESTQQMVHLGFYMDPATDEAEARKFFSSLLQQRIGCNKAGGSVSVIALCSDTEDTVEATEDATYTLADFVAINTRESVMSRLRALDGKGIKLTSAILKKIDVAEPKGGRVASRTRSSMVEMLTSIADAHVDVTDSTAEGVTLNPALSLQRVGVGGKETKAGDPRCAAMRTLGVGHQLRLELAANVANTDGDAGAADNSLAKRAAAWRAALRAQPTPQPLSAMVVTACTVQAGLLDGKGAADAAAFLASALAAAQAQAGAVLAAIDESEALSTHDADALKKLLVAASK